MSTTLENIQQQIGENTILLYMKGTPQLPQCGFSAQAVQAVMACGERFAFVNILDNPDIRAELPKYANWPTFPQLWVNGELVGGCDIIVEMYESGELEKLIKDAAASAETEKECGASRWFLDPGPAPKGGGRYSESPVGSHRRGFRLADLSVSPRPCPVPSRPDPSRPGSCSG